MLKFLQDRKVGKGKKAYLSDLSKIAKDEREKILLEKVREIVLEEIKNSRINDRLDDISKFTQSMEKKMDELKSSIAPLSRSKTDSIRKLKMKRVVIELLNKNRRMSACDLSAELDLSRTRCSEYLTELEKAGITRGIVILRQKFYELNNEAAQKPAQ